MFVSTRFALILLCVTSVLGAGCAGEGSVTVDDGASVTDQAAATEDGTAFDHGSGFEDGTASEAPTVAVAENAETSAADPTSTVVSARSRGQQSTSESAQSYTSIRDVNFLDGFAHATDFDFGPDMVTLVDGSYENGEWGDEEYFWFGVTQVEIGDLDGDGVEDAIVATAWNGGGSGVFDSVTAYRLVDGHAMSAGRVHFGDRADGGIYDVRIEDGIAQVWSFSTTLGACCPSEVTRNNLVLGEHFLVVGDREQTRSWLSLNSSDELSELKFLAGTSSAVITIYGDEIEGGFTFEAAQGQLLTLALVDGPAPADVSVIDLATGQMLSGLAEISLASDSLYEVRVGFDAERDDATMLEVSITNDGAESARGAAAVSWTSTVAQELITETPFVTTSLVWPIFSSNQPGTTAANDALAAYVTALDDDWVEDVTLHTPPLDDSSYDVRYEVAFVSSEIVAVWFDYYEYVCCRPYPNYGPRGVVLDLAAGRIIPVDEILDTTRLDEITAIWLAELEKQNELGVNAGDLLAQDARFDAVVVVPEGIEFGTERGSLGGAMPGTRVVVTYGQLGDLVNPALVARLTAS